MHAWRLCRWGIVPEPTHPAAAVPLPDGAAALITNSIFAMMDLFCQSKSLHVCA